MKLFLTGYMGTGKTTVGRLLAKKFNWSFIDVDNFIENRYHKTVNAIFEEKGEAAFREIERHVLQEISSFEKVVVSTGGGLPCFFDNMDLMNRTGITIYLKSNVNDLVDRLNTEKHTRPLIRGKSPQELKDFVDANLKKREPFYKKSRFTFDVKKCATRKELNYWVEEIFVTILKIINVGEGKQE